MQQTFDEVMNNLGLSQSGIFHYNPDIELNGRYFMIMVGKVKGGITVAICEHEKEVYTNPRPLRYTLIDDNDDARLAIFCLISTTFIEHHLFREFQEYVKAHSNDI